jgi:hypothetical protein
MDIGLDVRRVKRAPEGVKETLAFIGLGSQVTRAALISTLATAIAYASKYPKHAFTPEGKMKRFSTTPEDSSYGESETTTVPFAVVPVLAFALGYVFF